MKYYLWGVPIFKLCTMRVFVYSDRVRVSDSLDSLAERMNLIARGQWCQKRLIIAAYFKIA